MHGNSNIKLRMPSFEFLYGFANGSVKTGAVWFP
jgi:hypothetical protein